MNRQPTVLEVTALVGSVAVLVVTLSATSLSWAASAPGTSASPPAKNVQLGTEAAAMRLLERAERANASTAYHGVQFISAWTEQGASGMVVKVNSRPGVGTFVHTEGNALTPASDTYLPAEENEPSLVSGSQALALLTTNFAVTSAGRRSVAGRSTQLVEARRPTSGVIAGRFWIDSETGLVLRREVYDERGRTTRASAFVELEIGRSGHSGASAARMPSAWQHRVDTATFARMRADGWHCPKHLGRSLSLVDARRGGGKGQPILHLSFSDGLSSVSLFEQRGRLDTEKLDGYRSASRRGGTVYIRDGVPARMVWGADDMVYTVVADAPADTLDEVLADLPQPDRDSGGWGRLSRGMNRVASWFNPFG